MNLVQNLSFYSRAASYAVAIPSAAYGVFSALSYLQSCDHLCVRCAEPVTENEIEFKSYYDNNHCSYFGLMNVFIESQLNPRSKKLIKEGYNSDFAKKAFFVEGFPGVHRAMLEYFKTPARDLSSSIPGKTLSHYLEAKVDRNELLELDARISRCDAVYHAYNLKQQCIRAKAGINLSLTGLVAAVALNYLPALWNVLRPAAAPVVQPRLRFQRVGRVEEPELADIKPAARERVAVKVEPTVDVAAEQQKKISARLGAHKVPRFKC